MRFSLRRLLLVVLLGGAAYGIAFHYEWMEPESNTTLGAKPRDGITNWKAQRAGAPFTNYRRHLINRLIYPDDTKSWGYLPGFYLNTAPIERTDEERYEYHYGNIALNLMVWLAAAALSFPLLQVLHANCKSIARDARRFSRAQWLAIFLLGALFFGSAFGPKRRLYERTDLASPAQGTVVRFGLTHGWPLPNYASYRFTHHTFPPGTAWSSYGHPNLALATRVVREQRLDLFWLNMASNLALALLCAFLVCRLYWWIDLLDTLPTAASCFEPLPTVADRKDRRWGGYGPLKSTASGAASSD